MRMPLMPSRAGLYGLGAVALVALLALLQDVPLPAVARAAAGVVLAWVLVDMIRSVSSWQRTPLSWQRRLPAALALGMPRTLSCALVNDGPNDWWVQLSDRVDESFEVRGLPLQIYVPAQSRIEVYYSIVPRRRGLVLFKPAELLVRTLHGSFEWRRRIGEAQTLRVYPDFAALSRHAALAKHGRLGEAGIRGQAPHDGATGFQQLLPYRAGEAARHIDWKATLRQQRPIARQFGHEGGQCVLFLLDCGERMRGDDAVPAGRGRRFDAALNALMLLSHVALSDGDEVGAMSFGTQLRLRRRLAPRRGPGTLDALMSRFGDIQPDAAPSDYRTAARELMQLRHKRALVVMLTRVRDEDSAELQPALALLRSRHAVLVVDTQQQPRRLAAELVNSYRAVKASGRL